MSNQDAHGDGLPRHRPCGGGGGSNSSNKKNNNDCNDGSTALRCCCGRDDCIYLKHNCSVLDSVEKDVLTAAKMGQVSTHIPLSYAMFYIPHAGHALASTPL
ncbi:hypothetical protein DL546_009901 [Coniochaeta pulveracea]|uniref:Uncharacterized protein n=1 Tax=Coniochaeta pulveracea TaxID=177199 RepID=A0A420YNQ3_9PEZI|nr:hypothetical protein DL546_009901 [Coniochaeta pulveracea]